MHVMLMRSCAALTIAGALLIASVAPVTAVGKASKSGEACAVRGSYEMGVGAQLLQCQKVKAKKSQSSSKKSRLVWVKSNDQVPFPKDPGTRVHALDLTAKANAATRGATASFRSGTGSDTLDIITGGYPDDTQVCDGEDYSLTAFVIQNSSSSPVNLQVYINSVLTRQALAYSATNPWIQSGANPSGACGWGSGQSQTASGTLAPNSAGLFYVAAGGQEQNLIGASHNVQFGIPGSDVYQFNLSLNIAGGFSEWSVLAGAQTTGPNTGGLTLNDCSVGGGQVFVASGVISNGWSPNGTPTYGQNAPICFNYS